MNINPDNIIQLISDKAGLLKQLLDVIDRNYQQAEGCKKLRESLVRKENPNHSPENLAHASSIALAVSAKNSEDLMLLAQLILVYSQGNQMSTDAAMMANKLGKGHDAIRAMFKAKMDGR